MTEKASIKPRWRLWNPLPVGDGVYQHAGPVAKSCLNRTDRTWRLI